MSLLQAHRAFLERALDRLTPDPRVAAVLLAGSAGRGEADEWSDLDIIVVADEETATVLATPAEAGHLGDLAIWVDCSFNAPFGGTQAFTRYLVPEGMVLVDCNAWPLAAARHPVGARLLWIRDGLAIEPFDGTSVDFVKSRPRRKMPPYSRQQRAEWELCMCHIAISLPMRGRDVQPALKLIGIEGKAPSDLAGQLNMIRDHIVRLEPWVTPRVFRPSLARVDTALAMAG